MRLADEVIAIAGPVSLIEDAWQAAAAAFLDDLSWQRRRYAQAAFELGHVSSAETCLTHERVEAEVQLVAQRSDAPPDGERERDRLAPMGLRYPSPGAMVLARRGPIPVASDIRRAE